MLDALDQKMVKGIDLKMVKTIRKPGSVKFLWDKRLVIYALLAGLVGTLALCFYISVYMVEPIGSFGGLQDAWFFVLLLVIGDVGITALILRYQGAIHVNRTKSKIEVFKGLGLNTRIHSLPFDTLEKIVLFPIISKWFTPPSGTSPKDLCQQVSIYLKNGQEIKLPFAQVPPKEGFEVVKEMAKIAGIPAFDREGKLIYSPRPLAVRT